MSEQLQQLTRREIAAQITSRAKTAIGISPMVETVQSLVDQTPISRRGFFHRGKQAAEASVSFVAGTGVALTALTGVDALFNPKGSFALEAAKAGAQWFVNRIDGVASAQEAQPVNTYQVSENTIWGPVTANVREDYTYADRLPAGDLRIGGGVTLNDPSEVERFLQDNQDFLYRKAGGNQKLFERLDAVSSVIRNNLADLGFNVDVLKGDDVLMGQQIPLSDVPQTIINVFPELKDQILAEFSKKGMEVVPETVTSFDAQGNAFDSTQYKLTRGVVPQVIANPGNLAQKMFIFAKIVSPENHDLNKFQFGTHEGYWVIAQRQQMEDGKIRTLITFLRNECVNTVVVAIKTEEVPPVPTPTTTPVPGETTPPTEVSPTPTNTAVPAVPTPGAPPVDHQVTSIPTKETSATPTETTPPTEIPTPTSAPTNTTAVPTETPGATATPIVNVTETATPTPIGTRNTTPTALTATPTEIPSPTVTPIPATKTPTPAPPSPAPTNTIAVPTETRGPTATPIKPNTQVPTPTPLRGVLGTPTPVH